MGRSSQGGKEVGVLVASLVVTVGILGGAAYVFRDALGGLIGGGGAVLGPGGGGEVLLSAGERSLVPNPSPLKAQGITAYGQGDYAAAVTTLTAALQDNRNDPEALIYLNNARIGDRPAATIAVVTPMGASLEAGLEILRGIAQAQDEINLAATLPLRVLIADDRDNSEQARQVATALARDPNVLAVVGHFSSGVTLAVEPIYTQANLPLISPTSTALALTGRSEFFWRTVPSDRFTAAALSRYLLASQATPQVATFYNGDSDYSLSLKNELTTALLSDGGSVVAEFNVADPGFNAAQGLAQAQQRGATAIALVNNTGTLDAAIAVIQANQGQLPLVGGDSLYNPRILQQGQAAAVGMVVAIPWHIQAHPDSPFTRNSRALWGGDVNWRTATTYDAVQAIAAVLATQPSPSRQSLQQGLRAPAFQTSGSNGPVQFLPSGDRNAGLQLVVIVPGDRSSSGFDYEPVP